MNRDDFDLLCDVVDILLSAPENERMLLALTQQVCDTLERYVEMRLRPAVLPVPEREQP